MTKAGPFFRWPCSFSDINDGKSGGGVKGGSRLMASVCIRNKGVTFFGIKRALCEWA